MMFSSLSFDVPDHASVDQRTRKPHANAPRIAWARVLDDPASIAIAGVLLGELQLERNRRPPDPHPTLLCILLFAAATLAVNLATDLACRLLHPRIRRTPRRAAVLRNPSALAGAALLRPLVAAATLSVGAAILFETGLAFLGLADPDRTSWGAMVGGNRDFALAAWWTVLPPGLAIFFTVLGVSLLGDGVTEALDPRARPAVGAAAGPRDGALSGRSGGLARRAGRSWAKCASGVLSWPQARRAVAVEAG